MNRALWLCFLLLSVFTTTSHAADPIALTVASDGSGDFDNVQAAVDAVPADNARPHVIAIRPGVYKQRLLVPKDKPHVTLRGLGDDPAEVVLTYDLHASMKDPATGKDVGTSGSASAVIDSPDFTAENLTFENSAGDVGQAVAIRIMGDRAAFRRCRFLGWQDTLYANSHGRNYFVDCYIEGRVDFIFGRSTALFERCHIHSKNGGYITAASTPQERDFGYVFLRCRLTGEGAPAFLGRPWRPYAAVAFLECEFGDHIRPQGWDNWRNPQNEKTARFAEFRNTGPGADTAGRVEWATQLSPEQAARYTPQAILGGDDAWSPWR
jgi:pectinesterase